MFTGFPSPEANWYRLPNTWFSIWQTIRTETGRSRIGILLKLVEYVIKWSWGFQNFNVPIRLSWQDILTGRRHFGRIRDRGTGISRGGLQQAIEDACRLGLLERSEMESGAAHTYLPRLAPPEPEAPTEEIQTTDWQGFAPPRSNFFKVPKIWTDLTTDISSAVTILTVEYSMRHTWGWATWDGGPCWLSAEEIATGRRYRSPERAGKRYDDGIGYTRRSVSEALRDGVARGLLVWRETETGERVFALHLEGMEVDAEGRWLPPAEPVVVEESLLPPAPQASPSQPPTPGPTVEQLAQQIEQLTVLLKTMAAALKAAGVPLPQVETPTPPVTASRPPLEADGPPEEVNRPATEAIRPGREATRPHNNTLSNTPSTAATHAPKAQKGQPAAGAWPGDIEAALRRINFRGQKSEQELRAAYIQDTERVRWWILHLAKTRGGDPRAAGFLLQTVVRDGAPVPHTARPHGDCETCHGSGLVYHDGKASRCPICATPAPISPENPAGWKEE